MNRALLVLHTHIPFVLGHGSWPHGSDWLCEAAAESYLPLLEVLADAPRARSGPAVVVGMTPVLAEQLASECFRETFDRYLQERHVAALLDVEEFSRSGASRMEALARRWANVYEAALEAFWGRWRGRLLKGFASLADEGVIELAGSAATHAYLPLLGSPTCIEAQIELGRQAHRSHFGSPAATFWLPECAYAPGSSKQAGLEEPLERAGVRAVFLEAAPCGRASSLAGGDRSGSLDSPTASPAHAYRPWRVGRSSVTAFLRDPNAASQVWNARHGYPGDARYLEFHKRRWPGGLRYWRVSDGAKGLNEKDLYAPEAASQGVQEHAGHFVSTIRSAADRVATTEPLVTVMFDTELLGHWWFEGPGWLREVLRRLDGAGIGGGAPSTVLAEKASVPSRAFPEGSWGEGGDHRTWWNPKTHWLWDEVRMAEAELEHLARRSAERPRPPQDRVLRQLAREVVLMESSDWPFLITRDSARDYAEARVREHARCVRLLSTWARRLLAGEELRPVDERELVAIERRDFLFQDIDWRLWVNA